MRLIKVLVLGGMILSFAACGTTASSSSTPTPTPESSTCSTSTDCSSDNICWYGTCKLPADVGADLSSTCTQDSDCTGEGSACWKIDARDCQGRCVQASFRTGAPNTSEACLAEAVRGVWYCDTICLTADVATCAGIASSNFCPPDGNGGGGGGDGGGGGGASEGVECTRGSLCADAVVVVQGAEAVAACEACYAEDGSANAGTSACLQAALCGGEPTCISDIVELCGA